MSSATLKPAFVICTRSREGLYIRTVTMERAKEIIGPGMKSITKEMPSISREVLIMYPAEWESDTIEYLWWFRIAKQVAHAVGRGWV